MYLQGMVWFALLQFELGLASEFHRFLFSTESESRRKDNAGEVSVSSETTLGVASIALRLEDAISFSVQLDSLQPLMACINFGSGE